MRVLPHHSAESGSNIGISPHRSVPFRTIDDAIPDWFTGLCRPCPHFCSDLIYRSPCHCAVVGLPTRREALAQQPWRTELDGQLSASTRTLRLIVRKADGCARYLILQRLQGRICSEVLLASGTEISTDAAMTAAGQAAIRIEFMLAKRISRNGLDNGFNMDESLDQE
jgi:hypothetical protein